MNFQNLLKQANYTLLLPRTGGKRIVEDEQGGKATAEYTTFSRRSLGNSTDTV